MSNFKAGGVPSPGSAFVAGLESVLPVIGQLTTTLTGEQNFGTIPVTPTRIALYAMSIRAPGLSLLAYATYTFPLSPASVSQSFIALTNFFDVQGDPNEGGVARIIDSYGNTPVMYAISGTTGWKMHASDGYGLTGLESVQALKDFLNLYAQINAIQSASNQPPYTLEFYDYFSGEFWQIEPVGPQEFRQSKDRPLLTNYNFRFAGVKNLNAPITDLLDGLAKLINNPAQQGLAALGRVTGNMLANYAGNTPGAFSLDSILNLL